ncbi:768_t:CDS:1, partial [Funneliformis caledonium]
MTKSATQRAKESEYKDNIYVDRAKHFCRLCKEVLDHKKKSTLDNHFKSKKHKKNVQNSNNNLQRTLTVTIQQFMSDKDQINCDL